MTNFELPKTMDEAVDILMDIMEQEDLNALRNMKQHDLIRLHFGLGLFIRNNFGLWNPEAPIWQDIRGTPDDTAMDIIEKLWERLNNETP